MKDIIEMAHSIKVAVLAEVGEDYSNMLESRIEAVDFVTQKITEQYISSDYWTRLEHQYAGMAMQGILSNQEYLRSLMHTKHDDYRVHEVVPNVAVRLSHALVEKLKEKEERK